jgi:hypothetical protein
MLSEIFESLRLSNTGLMLKRRRSLSTPLQDDGSFRYKNRVQAVASRYCGVSQTRVLARALGCRSGKRAV